MNGGLFAKLEARAPPSPPRYRLPLEKHSVKRPVGKPDKRGVHWWQKMHAVIEKMPEHMRERFNDLTYGENFSSVEAFEKALRMYVSASVSDLQDFDVSRGLLREE